jgi:hypothetical protein
MLRSYFIVPYLSGHFQAKQERETGEDLPLARRVDHSLCFSFSHEPFLEIF